MKVRTGIALVAVAGAGAAVATRNHRRTRAMQEWFGHRVRYLEGKLQGETYKAFGGRPDPEVSDDILADRVRTRLGPITKRLDLPHVHVSVADHIVTLHGDVANADDAFDIEETVAATSGVRGVVSLLHEGLLRSDSRPSEGARRQHSEVFHRLVVAARDAGCREGADRRAVRAVMAAVFEPLPLDLRAHLVATLPLDVERLTLLPRRIGAPSEVRDTKDFVAAVAAVDRMPTDVARNVLMAVLGALRKELPEDAERVRDYLPEELREAWSAPASRAS